MSLTELAERVGVTIANLSILKTGKAKAIRFSTLDAICRELGCQPGELMAWEAGPTNEDGEEDGGRSHTKAGAPLRRGWPAP